MMRITGGTLRGRLLRVPASEAVRPTQDQVRAALFSMLGERVAGAVFIDLFGGTGAVGIEAVSRGASEVVWIEANRNVARTLTDNVNTLCEGGTGLLTCAQNTKNTGQKTCATFRVIASDVFAWLKRPPPLHADIIFADPPYGDTETDDRLAEVMTLLASSSLLKPGGLFIAEQRLRAPQLPVTPPWSLITERRYGHTRLSLFEKTNPM